MHDNPTEAKRGAREVDGWDGENPPTPLPINIILVCPAGASGMAGYQALLHMKSTQELHEGSRKRPGYIRCTSSEWMNLQLCIFTANTERVDE